MASNSQIRTVLVTGQSNEWHNWKTSHVALRKILDQSGRFSVDVVVSPPAGGAMSGFAVDWTSYDLAVIDYEGDEWPLAVRESFEGFVECGGGVVIYHAADNAFPDWAAYNEMIGVGGWGGRDESAGLKLRWRDGRVVRDDSPGVAMHPAPFEFAVTTRDGKHPIMQGLPAEWLHVKDELYSQLRGPGRNVTVLATANADPAEIEGGTGEHEPMLMTVAYGDGRVFHTTLGHVGPQDSEIPPCLKCVGFITTFLRGAEWAATGEVTLPVPVDFPSADAVSARSHL